MTTPTQPAESCLAATLVWVVLVSDALILAAVALWRLAR